MSKSKTEKRLNPRRVECIIIIVDYKCTITKRNQVTYVNQ